MRIAAAVAVLGALIATACTSPASPAPTLAPARPVATATSAPVSTTPPTSTTASIATKPATPTATPAPSPALVWVGGTGGQGAYLRHSPRLADKALAYVDGTELRVAGPDVDGDGTTWRHVVAPDGAEGFVPAAYSIAQRPVAVAAAAATQRPPVSATAAPAARTATATPSVRPTVAAAIPAPPVVRAQATLPSVSYACSPPGLGCGETSRTTGLPRTQYVSGYTRRDGTYVRPYYRSHR
jgi:hypothetical protein